MRGRSEFFGGELLKRVKTGFVDNARFENWREHPDSKKDELIKSQKEKRLFIIFFVQNFVNPHCIMPDLRDRGGTPDQLTPSEDEDEDDDEPIIESCCFCCNLGFGILFGALFFLVSSSISRQKWICKGQV